MAKKRIAVAAIALALFVCLPVAVNAAEVQTVKVFHAGSLALPFEEAEKQFEALHPGVDIQRESHGSAEAIRQITEVGKPGDVLGSADYALIPNMMYPEFADWYVRFATNEIVLAYNAEMSHYATEITPDNWYEILRRDDVTFGFSNPNLDPCGYRSVMVCQLAELRYNDARIFDDLILKNTAITMSEENGTYLIQTPEQLEPKTRKVTIKPKEVDLTALVEAGGLDYYFIYRSVAAQHRLPFVDLPAEIDLSAVEYVDTYKKVKLRTMDGKTQTATPIVYGITVPKQGDNPEMGMEFVKFVIGESGQKIFADNGQPPIVPPVGSGNVPEELNGLVQLESAPSTSVPPTTPTTIPTSAPKQPGFEAVAAVAGIGAIAYLVLRRDQ
ncbi:MAG: tungstate ABC transporter substrate-binding protein WtpA [Methanophagales archaeon ANME-1-THS]|nr:MAG: tungstate ABC transporter substrate-binding protein WtpA [Methanophagales archaeon ANME-1-THS]